MAQQESGKRKWWKWILGILGVFILIIAGVALYFSAKWKPLISNKVKEGVYNGSNGLYKLDFKDIHLNLITGTVSLDQVSLTPDTLVFARLKKLKSAPTHLFQLKLEKLQLNHISVLTAYFKRKLEVNSIVLEHPSINMIYNKVQKRPDTIKDDKTLYQQISNTLKSVHIKAIRIVDADFDYVNGVNLKPMKSIKHLNINVKDLLIDSLTQFDSTRFYYTKDISFELRGYESKDKMYRMKADTISGSAVAKTISIKGFKMIPLYPDLSFSRMFKYGKDRYDLDFELIRLTGVDFVGFNVDGNLHAKALTIGPAKAGIFLNRELPAPPGLDKGRNFPHMALRRVPIQLVIDTVKLDNIDVAYTEYNPISQKRGTMFFQNLSGKILNVTNDSTVLLKNNHAIANLNALVMKKAKIDIRIDFSLIDKDAAFKYSGVIGPMNLVDLNQVSKPLGLIEIESGKMQKADFDINANRYGSSGKVHFYYTDLKLKLLKEGEDGKPAKEKGLLSFLANTLLIKNANPDKGEAPRTANITFQRSPGASFFNLLWKGVFIGMRETAGLGIVPVKTPEQGMKKINDKKQERKEKREERKKKQIESAEKDKK